MDWIRFLMSLEFTDAMLSRTVDDGLKLENQKESSSPVGKSSSDGTNHAPGQHVSDKNESPHFISLSEALCNHAHEEIFEGLLSIHFEDSKQFKFTNSSSTEHPSSTPFLTQHGAETEDPSHSIPARLLVRQHVTSTTNITPGTPETSSSQQLHELVLAVFTSSQFSKTRPAYLNSGPHDPSNPSAQWHLFKIRTKFIEEISLIVQPRISIWFPCELEFRLYTERSFQSDPALDLNQDKTRPCEYLRGLFERLKSIYSSNETKSDPFEEELRKTLEKRQNRNENDDERNSDDEMDAFMTASQSKSTEIEAELASRTPVKSDDDSTALQMLGALVNQSIDAQGSGMVSAAALIKNHRIDGSDNSSILKVYDHMENTKRIHRNIESLWTTSDIQFKTQMYKHNKNLNELLSKRFVTPEQSKTLHTTTVDSAKQLYNHHINRKLSLTLIAPFVFNHHSSVNSPDETPDSVSDQQQPPNKKPRHEFQSRIE